MLPCGLVCVRCAAAAQGSIALTFQCLFACQDTEAVANLLQKARSELEVVKRSRTVDNLYSKGQSVLDKM